MKMSPMLSVLSQGMAGYKNHKSDHGCNYSHETLLRINLTITDLGLPTDDEVSDMTSSDKTCSNQS